MRIAHKCGPQVKGGRNSSAACACSTETFQINCAWESK